jgi:hypothetical protein
MKSLLYYMQVLSLDICIGVIGSGAFAKTFLRASMKPVWWFLLPASVWVIYTADQLMDARKVGARSVNVRHKFHFDHFKILALIAAVTCCILAFLYLREMVFIGGFMMGGLAVMHILIAYWGKVRFGKEISVAVIYACGVWFAPFLNRGVEISPLYIAAFVIFILGAILNLFMNSVIEFAIDRQEGQVFGMGLATRKAIRRAVIGVSFGAIIGIASFAIYGFIHGLNPVVLAGYGYLLLVCAVPGIILFYEDFFAKDQRYRLPAELVFCVGAVLLAFRS